MIPEIAPCDKTIALTTVPKIAGSIAFFNIRLKWILPTPNESLATVLDGLTADRAFLRENRSSDADLCSF